MMPNFRVLRGGESQSRKRVANGDPKDTGSGAQEGRADSGGDPPGSRGVGGRAAETGEKSPSSAWWRGPWTGAEAVLEL